jgi:hypothetical protein
MNTSMFRDEEILNEDFRYAIIREIEGPENTARKAERFQRFQVFMDMTDRYVMNRLKAQGFEESTIEVMRQRRANISICKKIIKKKSRAYNAGVDRNVPGDDVATEAVRELSDYLGVTQAFKEADEYRNLSRNALIFPHPIIDGYADNFEGGTRPIYGMTTRVFSPHAYDIIPDSQNRERARCVILSEWPGGRQYAGAVPMEYAGGGRGGYVNSNYGGDGVDQRIANSLTDIGAGKKQYIWWTAKYHFTTDCYGKIVTDPMKTPADLMNPIQMLPQLTIAMEQKGNYWGNGGDDVIDGSVLINVLLTDAAAILNLQGWGQPVMIGKNLKGGYRMGPQIMLELSYQDGEDKPEYKVVSTDPHTEMWIKLVEVYIAMLLTTNNLSPRNVSGDLNTSSLASGIAKMIDESESTDDINESQNYYVSKERQYWAIVTAWLNAFRNTEALVEQLQTMPEFNGDDVNTRFHSQSIVLSEKEQLEILQLRKELGIDTMVDILRRDDPSLSEEDAQAKLQKILADKMVQEVQQQFDSKLVKTAQSVSQQVNS